VGDKSDQLPIMQHALMRTWEEWERETTGRQGDGATGQDDNPQPAIRNPQSNQVDLLHYEAVGGIKDALSKDAEAALDEMGDYELKITERMFQILTDTDARNRRLRRPAHLSEIEAITGADRETILKIIERFTGEGRSFLIMTNENDPLIDISHEILIRQWERMNEWAENENESRKMYLRLVDDAGTYQRLGNEDLLWMGTQLGLGLEWLDEKKPNSKWAQRYQHYHGEFEIAVSFLEASRHKDNEEKEKVTESARAEGRHEGWAEGGCGCGAAILLLIGLLIVFSMARCDSQVPDTPPDDTPAEEIRN
jgi:conflict system STAND superfamily ATPase